MNLLEFENIQFPNTWNEETIKELQKCEPHSASGTPIGTEPASYYCWQGTRIPQWFE